MQGSCHMYCRYGTLTEPDMFSRYRGVRANVRSVVWAHLTLVSFGSFVLACLISLKLWDARVTRAGPSVASSRYGTKATTCGCARFDRWLLRFVVRGHRAPRCMQGTLTGGIGCSFPN